MYPGSTFHEGRADPPAGGMQLLARCHRPQDDQLLCTRLAAAGVTARPLSSPFIRKPTAFGLFLGFATWTAEEIDIGAYQIGRLVAKYGY